MYNVTVASKGMIASEIAQHVAFRLFIFPSGIGLHFLMDHNRGLLHSLFLSLELLHFLIQSLLLLNQSEPALVMPLRILLSSLSQLALDDVQILFQLLSVEEVVNLRLRLGTGGPIPVVDWQDMGHAQLLKHLSRLLAFHYICGDGPKVDVRMTETFNGCGPATTCTSACWPNQRRSREKRKNAPNKTLCTFTCFIKAAVSTATVTMRLGRWA